MRFFDAIWDFFERFADHLATRRRLSRFTCGDCERHNQCGLPPSDRCAVRMAQIARDGDHPRSRSLDAVY